MLLSELHYDLPSDLIAQRAVEPRDASRLLVLDRATGDLQHRTFRDIREYLRPGDALVINDTRVIPARFFCRRPTGGHVEGLYLHQVGNLWRVLLKPGARLKIGEQLACHGCGQVLVIRERHDRGEWAVLPDPPVDPVDLLGRIGLTPLPPYIHRDPKPDAYDEWRYQTVYARRPGAAAAPTAGLHFTPELLADVQGSGVKLVHVTLHVGVGTFAPIGANRVEKHRMHAEYFDASADAVAALHTLRSEGGRVFAVGTTSVRVLESLRLRLGGGDAPPDGQSGWTEIFIYPPYEPRNVDCLLTNFHQPCSSLLAMIMAFAGKEQIRQAYAAAIEQRYRFFSYGDAMLIL